MRFILAIAVALSIALPAAAASPTGDLEFATAGLSYKHLLDDGVTQVGCTTCPTDGCGDSCLCGDTAGGCQAGKGCATGACCGSGCGGCGGCGPQWAVGVDWMFLGRSVPDSHQALVECNCTHPHEARFTANDFDPGWSSGARVRAYRRCKCGPDYEFTYLEMDEWNDNRHFAGDLTVLCCPIGDGTAYANFDSTLRGAEFNSFTDCDCWTRFLVGIRWIQLDESSELGGTGTLGSQYHAVDANNNLFGAQIGLNRLILDNGGPWKVDLEILTGLYANIMDVDRVGCACGSSQDNTSLGSISEIELAGAYAINCCWSFNVGAHFLWLSGVASAPEQFYHEHYIYDDSTVFFAGGSLGFTKVW